MASPKSGEREHFDRIAGRYEQASHSWQSIYDQLEGRLNPLVAGRRVLSVGSGANFGYDTSLPAQTIALDISPSMLDAIDRPDVVKRVGDARELRSIGDASIDVVLFVLSLHHINGPSVRDSLETLERVFAAARRVLRPGGHLVVVESVVPRWYFALERLLFPLTRRLLGRFGVSMIFLYPLPVLERQIAAHLQVEATEIERLRLDVDERIDPFGGSFPGWVSVPARYLPGGYYLVVARAPVATS